MIKNVEYLGPGGGFIKCDGCDKTEGLMYSVGTTEGNIEGLCYSCIRRQIFVLLKAIHLEFFAFKREPDAGEDGRYVCIGGYANGLEE